MNAVVDFGNVEAERKEGSKGRRREENDDDDAEDRDHKIISDQA